MSGNEHESANSRSNTGLIVGGILTVLTIVEYFVAVGMTDNLIWLLIIAIAKAWLILKYFMHIGALWSEGGEH